MAVDPMDMVQGFAFWRDGCRMMAGAICEALRSAKEPITPDNIIVFVSSLPRSRHDLNNEVWQKGYCSCCLAKAFGSGHNGNVNPHDNPLVDYFLRYFVDRNWTCQDMLIDAVIGIFSGISWEDWACPKET